MANWDFYTKDGFLKVGLVTSAVGDAATLDGYDSTDFILKAGDTGIGNLALTGAAQISLPADPVAGTDATRQSYTEARYLKKELGETDTLVSDVTVDAASGGSLLRNSTGDTPVAGEYVWKEYVDGEFFPLSGGSLTGDLTIDGSLYLPTSALGVVAAVSVPVTAIPTASTNFAISVDVGTGPETTSDLQWDGTSAAAMQSAIEALPSVGVGNVSVSRTGTGTLGDPYVFLCSFTGALELNDVDVAEVAASVNPIDNGATVGVAYPSVAATLDNLDRTVLVNTSKNVYTVNLPGSPVAGQFYEIKDAGALGVGNASTNSISVVPTTALLDGNGAAHVLSIDAGAIVVVSNEFGDWHIVSELGATSSVASLDDLTDVSAASPVADSLLRYNFGAGEWQDTTLATLNAAGRLSVTTDSIAAGIGIGTDVAMYRYAADTLEVPDKVRLMGGYTTAQTTVSSTTTVDLVSNHVILADSSGGAFTISLPTGHEAGDTVVIKDSTGSSFTNNITIDTNDAAVIDGNATLVLATNWSAVTLQSNGTDWFVI